MVGFGMAEFVINIVFVVIIGDFVFVKADGIF